MNCTCTMNGLRLWIHTNRWRCKCHGIQLVAADFGWIWVLTMQTVPPPPLLLTEYQVLNCLFFFFPSSPTPRTFTACQITSDKQAAPLDTLCVRTRHGRKDTYAKITPELRTELVIPLRKRPRVLKACLLFNYIPMGSGRSFKSTWRTRIQTAGKECLKQKRVHQLLLCILINILYLNFAHCAFNILHPKHFANGCLICKILYSAHCHSVQNYRYNITLPLVCFL